MPQDEEPRVRGSVADCLRQLARQQGTVVFETMGPQIIHSIQSAFVSSYQPLLLLLPGLRRLCVLGISHSTCRLPSDSLCQHAFCKPRARARTLTLTERLHGFQARDPPHEEDAATETASSDYLNQLLQTSYQRQRPGKGELRHDTEGWRFLESSFKALQVGNSHTMGSGFNSC